MQNSQSLTNSLSILARVPKSIKALLFLLNPAAV